MYIDQLIKKSVNRLALLSFSLILMDATLNYFSIYALGLDFSINIIVGVVFGLAMILGVSSYKRYIPEFLPLMLFVILITGFILGIGNEYYDASDRVNRIATLAIAFFVGYACFLNPGNSEWLGRIFLLTSGITAATCFIALNNIYPSIFPVVNYVGYSEGDLVIRPEVTTDQNFQVFYLFSSLFGMIMLVNPKLKVVSVLVWMVGLYCIILLQSRSGFIVMALSFLLVMAVSIKKNILSYTYFIFLIGVGIVLVLLNLDMVVGFSTPLYERAFEDEEMHNLTQRTDSAMILFSYLASPSTWIPQGLELYVDEYGMLPHSNPTSVYLEGGIISLLGLVGLQLYPLYKWIALELKRKANNMLSVASIGLLLSFVSSLGLSTAYYEHVYLWIGAVWAALYQNRHSGVVSRKSGSTRRKVRVIRRQRKVPPRKSQAID